MNGQCGLVRTEIHNLFSYHVRREHIQFTYFQNIQFYLFENDRLLSEDDFTRGAETLA